MLVVRSLRIGLLVVALVFVTAALEPRLPGIAATLRETLAAVTGCHEPHRAPPDPAAILHLLWL